MAEFTYEALTATGQRSSGTLSGTSERDIAAQLDAKGLYPVRITPVATTTRRFGGGVHPRHMAVFYAQLADLLRSGVPLLRSLDILERMGAHPNLQAAIREVRAKVADGMGLAQAMAQHPKVFDELAISMVRAGQEGGFLEDVLKRIADFTEHQQDLKAKVVGALAYPVFLAVIGFIVLNVLIIVFVPRFEPIFARLRERGELPALTTWLIGLSHFMWPWGLLSFIGLIFLLILFRSKGMTPTVRLYYDRLKLRIPAAGRIFLNLGISRFTRILGTLLHNGIPILRSLEIAKDSTGNRVLTQAIEQSAENITAGEKLATPLGACPYFPRDIVEMIAIAEESNSLETVLVEIADSLEKRTARQLELFVRLLEPVMLLVMAMVVLIVVAGLMLPIFKMGSTVKQVSAAVVSSDLHRGAL
jgi:general secretion pathway protein F/type IV pilus assembly protein PilC